ncbi:MAG: DMT family transporter [Solirubrobacterales bacterium]
MTSQTLAILLGLSASATWGVSDFLGGQQSRRIPALSVVAVSYPAGFVVVGLVALLAGGSLPADQALLAALAGVAGAVAITLFYAAMAIGPVSIVAPVSSLGVVIPVAVGLARGEAPGPLQVAGLVLAIIGIALAVREAEAPHTVRVSRRALLLATLAGAGFGLFFTGIDGPASHDPLWTSATARLGGSVAIGAVLLAAPPERGPGFDGLPILLLIGTLDAGANILVALATSKGYLSLVAVAASLFPIVTVLLARVFLSERLERVQQAGVVLALVGVVLIAGG